MKTLTWSNFVWQETLFKIPTNDLSLGASSMPENEIISRLNRPSVTTTEDMCALSASSEEVQAITSDTIAFAVDSSAFNKAKPEELESLHVIA